MISDHVSAEAGSVGSCASVAWPEKLIVSPTFHVRVEAGESMTATGAVLPAVMVTEVVSLAPWSSVTRRLAVYTPAVVYVNVAVGVVASPNIPSPLRSQE